MNERGVRVNNITCPVCRSEWCVPRDAGVNCVPDNLDLQQFLSSISMEGEETSEESDTNDSDAYEPPVSDIGTSVGEEQRPAAQDPLRFGAAQRLLATVIGKVTTFIAKLVRSKKLSKREGNDEGNGTVITKRASSWLLLENIMDGKLAIPNNVLENATRPLTPREGSCYYSHRFTELRVQFARVAAVASNRGTILRDRIQKREGSSTQHAGTCSPRGAGKFS
ncbi:unnamed protein product [Soboliphyme baturini]|uniref:RING-type domain-containing protein n=1 Tax=Soboliphyme baturini TaxID=241478 RepID=A0A183ILF0_9BILA|nr:unnamed protein product [Soboliphyme baturini]